MQQLEAGLKACHPNTNTNVDALPAQA